MTKVEVPTYFTNHHAVSMTLRDYFAAKAMQAYMIDEVWSPDTFKSAAIAAYSVADAMLKAREQE